MMILSRIWYVLLSLVVGAAVYVVSLAVGQYDRRAALAMTETLKGDSQVVSWALQIDARRRLDNLLLVSADDASRKALKGANGKDTIPPSAKEDGRKVLAAFNDKLPAEFKNDALFLVDRDGRVISQVGYDAANGSSAFELGGYPAVFDSLHGNLRDDTWIWDGKVGRVVTRPIEDEIGQPPLGAVVAVRWVDAVFAKEIAKRTRTNVAFFSGVQKPITGTLGQGEEFDETTFNLLPPEIGKLFDPAGDKGYKDSGRTDVARLSAAGNEKAGAIFVRLPGDAWEMKENGAGFAVVRPRVTIGGPMGFVTGADDKDKASVKLWLVIAVVVGGSLFGFLFSFFEHSRPQKEMLGQAQMLRVGKIDALQLPRFSGGLRSIAQDINLGMERVVEKAGGQAKRPANLESILGPVPAQPAMSAFSFPLADSGAGSGPMPNVPPAHGSSPGAFGPPSGHGGPRPPMHQPHQPPMHQPPMHQPPMPPGSGPRAGGPTQLGGPGATAMGPMGAGPPPAFPGGALPQPRLGSGTQPGGARPVTGSGTGPVPVPVHAAPAPLFNPMAPLSPDADREEATMVGEPPAALLAAATGQYGASKPGDENSEWLTVYDDFIRTKRQCNEPVDGLTFEKFQQTLRKNRDTLLQKHGCKRVKFSVYVKDGRASLKATPVRD